MAHKPLEMRLCEIPHVALKPNQPYIFTVDVTCPECLTAALNALGYRVELFGAKPVVKA